MQVLTAPEEESYRDLAVPGARCPLLILISMSIGTTDPRPGRSYPIFLGRLEFRAPDCYRDITF